MLICPKFIFLTMLSKILSIIALTWNTGPCHLSQVQKWIRVQLCSISSVQSPSCVLIFTTSWTEARQASLSIINSRSLLKLKSIESAMPSNHLILCRHLLLLPSIFPASGSFPMSQYFASGSQSFGASASASVLPINMIYFSIDWFDLLAVQESLKSSPTQQFKL